MPWQKRRCERRGISSPDTVLYDEFPPDTINLGPFRKNFKPTLNIFDDSIRDRNVQAYAVSLNRTRANGPELDDDLREEA